MNETNNKSREAMTENHNKTSMENRVMAAIESGKVKMKPRWVFVTGAMAGGVGLVLTLFSTAYLVNIMLFRLRIELSNRPMYGARRNLADLVTSFPWWVILAAGACLVISYWAARRLELAYKARFGEILMALIAMSLLFGFLIYASGINNQLRHTKPLRGIYGGWSQSGGGYHQKSEIIRSFKLY